MELFRRESLLRATIAMIIKQSEFCRANLSTNRKPPFTPCALERSEMPFGVIRLMVLG